VITSVASAMQDFRKNPVSDHPCVSPMSFRPTSVGR
jgi:hypothetical protein